MGILYLVATPIGNLEDITIRAIKTLFSADYIACEDTRKTGLLIQTLTQRYTTLLYSNVVNSKKPKLISYYDEIEFKRVPEIVEILKSGKSVALVSNAGTPLIADPGFKLVKECVKRGIKVVSIPGPSSVITALVSSGLPPDQFLFLGYLPSSQNKRVKILFDLFQCFKTFKEIHPAILFFETPHRLKESLTDIQGIFGDIEIVIARELTKIHEETLRGKITEIQNKFQKEKIRGEFVILI